MPLLICPSRSNRPRPSGAHLRNRPRVVVRAPDGRPPRPREPRARRARVSPLHLCGGRGSIVARLRRASEGTATRSTLFAFRCGGGVFIVYPLPPEITENSGGRLYPLRVPSVSGSRAKVTPVEGTPPPFLRPFRRSLSDRGFLACRTLSPRHIAHRFAHVSKRAAYLRVSRVLGFTSRRLAVQPSPRGRYLPRTTKKYKNTGKMRKKKRFFGVFGVVHRLFIIYI